MKKANILYVIITLAALSSLACTMTSEQSGEPWTSSQLLPPAELAATLENPEASKPIIFSIGPSALIKHSIDIGPGRDKENIDRLKIELEKLSRDTAIVIYCGCCPFTDCPNVRPAFRLLNEMKFTNHKLLNLSKNIKTDWLDKGYPKQ